MENLRRDALLESYQECVRRKMIDRLTSREQRILRNYLHDNGAPIRKGTGISIYRPLTEVLPEEQDSSTIQGEPLSTGRALSLPSSTTGPIYTQAPPQSATLIRPYSQALGSTGTNASNEHMESAEIARAALTSPFTRPRRSESVGTVNHNRFWQGHFLQHRVLWRTIDRQGDLLHSRHSKK